MPPSRVHPSLPPFPRPSLFPSSLPSSSPSSPHLQRQHRAEGVPQEEERLLARELQDLTGKGGREGGREGG
jgi:hypothetical protein